MPERKTIQRAQAAKRSGKAASSQAGEFVREEMHHIREGKHGARSTKQAVAIALSKARRAGVKLPAPKKGKASEETREKARRDLKKGASASKRASTKRISTTRSKAIIGALEREPKRAASAAALSKQAKSSARRRTREERSAAAKKAARTRKRQREKG